MYCLYFCSEYSSGLAKAVYICQANLLCDSILINVSFLIIENITLFAVPHMTGIARQSKGAQVCDIFD